MSNCHFWLRVKQSRNRNPTPATCPVFPMVFLWIAIENEPFVISGFTHWTWWFSMVMLDYQRVDCYDPVISWGADRMNPAISCLIGTRCQRHTSLASGFDYTVYLNAPNGRNPIFVPQFWFKRDTCWEIGPFLQSSVKHSIPDPRYPFFQTKDRPSNQNGKNKQ